LESSLYFFSPAFYHAASDWKIPRVKVIYTNDVASCVGFSPQRGVQRRTCWRVRGAVPVVACRSLSGSAVSSQQDMGLGDGGGVSAKNFAQSDITNIDSSEATKMGSGLRPFSLCGSLTNVSVLNLSLDCRRKVNFAFRACVMYSFCNWIDDQKFFRKLIWNGSSRISRERMAVASRLLPSHTPRKNPKRSMADAYGTRRFEAASASTNSITKLRLVTTPKAKALPILQCLCCQYLAPESLPRVLPASPGGVALWQFHTNFQQPHQFAPQRAKRAPPVGLGCITKAI